MPNLCSRHAARQNLKKAIAARITLQQKIIRITQNPPVMMTAVPHVLHASLL